MTYRTLNGDKKDYLFYNMPTTFARTRLSLSLLGFIDIPAAQDTGANIKVYVQ